MNESDRGKHYRLFKHAKNAAIWQIKGSEQHSPFFFTCGMSIDLDGAIDAYAPRGSRKVGRDALDNAVPIPDKANRPPKSPGWVPTYKSTVRDPRTGASVVQATGPGAGYYISESSLKDIFHGPFMGAGVADDPQYQTDASTYPYVALPQKFLRDSGVVVGDHALAIHGIAGDSSFAAYGDAKNKHVMGESSAALAKALGVPWHRSGGIPKGIVYIVFPGSGLGPKMRCSLSELPLSGMRFLQIYDEHLDLVTKVVSCFSPELPGVALAFRRLGFKV